MSRARDMNFLNLLVLVLPLALSVSAAATSVNGTLKNTKNEPIPYATVSIKNSNQGVISNLKGEFTLYLSPGDYVLMTRVLGYETSEQTIQVRQSVLQVTIILADASQEIGEVVVTKDKSDLAKQLLRKVQAKRKSNQDYINSFTAEYYCKNTLEKSLSNQIDTTDKIDTSSSRKNTYFQETYSKLFFKKKDRFKEVQQGYRDYQFQEYEKPNSSISLGAQISGTQRGDFYENQTLETNPLHIVHNRQESDFNLYQNTLDIPMFNETPFTSPIGDNALLVYNYDLVRSFFQDGQKIYEIRVWPKFKQSSLLSGTLYIEDETFALTSSLISFPSHSLFFLEKFDLVQSYIRIDSSYVLDREEYIYHSKSTNKITVSTVERKNGEILSESERVKHEPSYGNTVVQYKNHLINEEIANSFMNKGQLIYTEGADSLSDDFWNSVRPHTLKPKELSFIQKQDSIFKHRNSYEFLREQDSIVNAIKWYNILLTGMSHINRPKGMTYFFSPLLTAARPLAVGGYRHALAGSVEKKWNTKKKLTITYEANYGFRNQNVKGFGTIDYTFNPKKYSSFFIRGGDNYDVLNDDESLIATFGRGNFFRKINAGLGGQHEIVNGLLASGSLDFSTYNSIQNLTLAPWSERLFGGYNLPQNFPGYNQVILELGLVWAPKLQYVMTKYEKISTGTDYPKFSLNYRKGIKPLFGSDVNYDFLTAGVNQHITVGTLGTSKYLINAGRFVNDREIRIADQQFFRSSDRYFFSNPLYTFQYLDTALRTTKAFLQGQYLHQFNGALMNKIPVINKLKLQAMAGAGILMLEDNGYTHSEIFIGLSKSFRIKGQVFKITTAYVSAANTETGYTEGFKIGIDIYDSWNHSWSY
jgi:hypothetical protein